MTDREAFESIWKTTMVGLSMFFIVSCAVVFSVASRPLGDEKALQSDAFMFFALFAPFCVLLYGFMRVIRWIILTRISSREERMDA